MRAEIFVVVQDRRRLFREGLSLLLSHEPGLVVHEPVRTLGEVLGLAGSRLDVAIVDLDDVDNAAVDNDAVDTSPHETGPMPAGLAVLWDRLPGLRLVGTYLTRPRQVVSDARLVLVPQTGSLADFATLVTGEAQERTPQSYQSLPSSGEPAPGSLSGREHQVLALLSGGASKAQIAERLGITVKTVENYRQKIFTKLGVRKQTQAVSVAWRHGLVGPAGPAELPRVGA